MHCPVVAKPASSPAKVMDRTEVVYIVVKPADQPGTSLLSTLKIHSYQPILWKCLLYMYLERL